MFSSGGASRRLRQLLGEALRGVDDAVLADLGVFGSFQSLAVLWEAGWLGDGRSSVRITCAEMRQRLRAIAASRRPVGDVLDATHGAMVCVAASVAARTDGLDFLLDNGGGDPVLVRGHGARVLGWAGNIGTGCPVTVLGYADSVVDPELVAASPRQLPRRAVIRGAELPLVVALTTQP